MKGVTCADVDDLRVWVPPSPDDVCVALELSIGPGDSATADLFQVVVATPRALAGRPDRRKGKLLVVPVWDWPEVEAALKKRIDEARGRSWEEVVDRLRTHFEWEYRGMGPPRGGAPGSAPRSPGYFRGELSAADSFFCSRARTASSLHVSSAAR